MGINTIGDHEYRKRRNKLIAAANRFAKTAVPDGLGFTAHRNAFGPIFLREMHRLAQKEGLVPQHARA